MASLYNLETLQQGIEQVLDNHSFQTHYKFHCHVQNVEWFQENMRQLAHAVSTPLDNNNNEKTILDNNVTLQCGDLCFSVPPFRLVYKNRNTLQVPCRDILRNRNKAILNLTELLDNHANVLRLFIQWLYCNEFLENPFNVNEMVQLLEFANHILCPRLSQYTTTTCLVPAVTVENVFDMLQLGQLYGLERLQEKSVEVLGRNIEAFVESDEFIGVLREEACNIVQGGKVVDVPLAAEIRRAIYTCKEEMTRVEKSTSLMLLKEVVEKALASE